MTFETRACACIGPQNGQPLCPCRMRGVKIKNGRYVLPERDLGPVRDRPAKPHRGFYEWGKPAEKCLHEELDKANPDMKGKPRMLSCPCSKCSPRC